MLTDLVLKQDQAYHFLNTYSMFKYLFFVLAILLPCRSIAQHTAKPTVGARGLSTANSNLLLRDIHSLYSNPAGLAYIQSWEFNCFALNRYLLEELKTVSMGIASPLSAGGVGLKLSSYGFSKYREQQIGLAYGRKLFDNFSIGASFDWWATSIPEYGRASSLTFEIGMQYVISKQISMAMHLYNPIRAEIIEGAILPSFIAIGMNYQPADYLVWSTTIEQSSHDGTSIKTGLEYMVQEKVWLRCGVQTNPVLWNMGVGYKRKGWQINIGMGWQQVLGVQSGLGFVRLLD